MSFKRAQIASIVATFVDFAGLVFCVEVLHVWYVASTAMGALLGAVTNFLMGRHWSFEATHRHWGHQAKRYVLVSGGSLLLNSGGVYLFTDGFKTPYWLSKAIVALLIGFFYNYPLQRRFVFG